LGSKLDVIGFIITAYGRGVILGSPDYWIGNAEHFNYREYISL
jgi:hypothetical protein